MFSHINRVDIEFHSFCNRICDWCPNKTIDRHSTDSFLDLNIFRQVLQELYDNNFGTRAFGVNGKNGSFITLLGYQEPLSVPEKLKEYIQCIKEIFYDRNIKIGTNSNGDYFSEETILGLNLTTLAIQDYDCKGASYWKNKLKEAKCLVIDENDTELNAIHKNIGLITVKLNWTQQCKLENRGGYFSQEDISKSIYKWRNNAEKRTYPCADPIYYINIYHNGDVTPCCHIRPDNPNHKDFVLGNIYQDSLMDIFYSKKAQTFRNIMNKSEFELYPEPCKYCQKMRPANFFILDTTGKQELKEAIRPERHLGLDYLQSRKSWTQEQLKVWEQSKKFYKREIYSNKKLYANSYYNITHRWYNKETAKELYDIYIKNWKELENYYDTFIISEINNDYVDISGKDVSFAQFSFTSDSLKENYLKEKGFYQPMLAYKYKLEDKKTIVAGRHRLIALRELEKDLGKLPIKLKGFFLDSYNEDIEVKLIMPKILYNNILLLLNLKFEEFDKNNILLKTNNPIDIWIIMKILEKEMDFLIEYYYDRLVEDNISPSPFLNIT